MQYDLMTELTPLVDDGYRTFHCKLVPELNAENMLGVRMPALRALGKKLAKLPIAQSILDDTSADRYYEETVVRGVIIGTAKLSLEERLNYIADFVPRITNWAICDTFISGLRFKQQDLSELHTFLLTYLNSSAEFPARFGAVMLLRFFVREDYLGDTLRRLTAIPSPDYNARMGVAWALAECLVKFPQPTLFHLQVCELDTWTYRKTLQKALESKRLPEALRAKLKTFRSSL